MEVGKKMIKDLLAVILKTKIINNYEANLIAEMSELSPLLNWREADLIFKAYKKCMKRLDKEESKSERNIISRKA